LQSHAHSNAAIYSVEAVTAVLFLRRGAAPTTLLRWSWRAPSTERSDDSRNATPSGTQAAEHMSLLQPRMIDRLSLLNL
jgi:hypothetical protein